MVKKLAFAGVGLVAVVIFLKYLGLCGYVGDFCRNAKDKITQTVTPEMKIKRLTRVIEGLEPEMDKNRAVVAAQIVEVENLQKRIKNERESLAKTEASLKDQFAALENGKKFVDFGGRDLPAEKVKENLGQQWNEFKQKKARVDADEELLRIREEKLDVAKQKLTTMQNRCAELKTKVEYLKLELEKLRLAQTQGGTAFDDSQLSEANQLAEDLENQIATGQTAENLKKEIYVQKVLEKDAKSREAYKEMSEHFNRDSLADKK